MQFFDSVYDGTPPWDIGRPQPVVVELRKSGEIRGRVLDLGCGTGENSLYLAGEGHGCVGVDFAPKAIRRAQEKATARSLPVEFLVRSALEIGTTLGPFDTVLDCGLFHTFLDPHRPVYARSVHDALAPGGRFFVLCFSEEEPADWGGPRRVTQAELRATFGPLLEERFLRPVRFETNLPNIEGRAWLGAFERPGSEVTPRRGSDSRTRSAPRRNATRPAGEGPRHPQASPRTRSPR